MEPERSEPKTSRNHFDDESLGRLGLKFHPFRLMSRSKLRFVTYFVTSEVVPVTVAPEVRLVHSGLVGSVGVPFVLMWF